VHDLRHGRLDITPRYFQVDLPFYREHIQDFLPDRIIDAHTHVGTRTGTRPGDPEPDSWAEKVTMGHDMTVPALLDAYMKLLPGKDVGIVCFGYPDRNNVEAANSYISQELTRYTNVYGFCLTLPEWDEEELQRRIEHGGFCGMKSYLSMVQGMSPDEVTILDIYPHHQLRLAEQQGWVVMLHVPGAERLGDRRNVEQLHEICDRYPDLKLVIAHVGRTYCPGVAEKGLRAVKDLDTLYYDISASTCQRAFELVIDQAGPRHILYGSDLPIFAMRGKRVCEGDRYINCVYEADWEDEHTRRCPEEEKAYTFMLYEEILAFQKAAVKCGLGRSDIRDIFCNNALRLLPARDVPAG